jgi:hypothetical protein
MMPSNIAEATIFELRLIQEICSSKSLEFKYQDDLSRYITLAHSSHGESTNEKLQIQENRLKLGLPIFLNELNLMASTLNSDLAEIDWTGREDIGERVADLDLKFLNTRKIPISIKSGGPGTERNLGGRSLKKLLGYNTNSTIEEMLRQVLIQFNKESKNVSFGNSWGNIRKTMERQINSEHLRNIAAEIGKIYQIKFSLEIINAWNESSDKQKLELLKYLSLQNDPRDLGLKIFVADDSHAYFKTTLDIQKIKPDDLEIKINERSEKGTLDFLISGKAYWRLNVNFTNGLGLSPLAIRVFLI